ncbi:CrcB family protein [Alcanivorax sp. JB21]|uniref:fluoride efflux transporter FluC n=1 Tax=Alcanivorax limicola TaxID=2874102 RepID=UPI001CBFA7B4|nr:CrcB family protein [Alcanivorax limicola]MBZ2187836.1 CrcB family protein [Alcanivorax limicola]
MTRRDTPTWQRYAVVFAGGALGAGARCGLSLANMHHNETAIWPWVMLLIINVIGSLLIGLYAAAWSGRHALRDQFVMTGLLGGFTSFSLFSLESMTLWQAGMPGMALLCIGVSVPLWLLAVALGYAWGQKAASESGRRNTQP